MTEEYEPDISEHIVTYQEKLIITYPSSGPETIETLQKTLERKGYRTRRVEDKLYTSVAGRMRDYEDPQGDEKRMTLSTRVEGIEWTYLLTPDPAQFLKLRNLLPPFFSVRYTGAVFENPNYDDTLHEVRIMKETKGVLAEGFEPRLAPCPFCGDTRASEHKMGEEAHEVQCKGCSAFTWGPSSEDAIRAWNRRPDGTEGRD